MSIRWGLALILISVALVGLATLVHFLSGVIETDFLVFCGIAIFLATVGGVIVIAGWGKRRDE